MKLGMNRYLVLETYGEMILILYALQILDKFTLGLLFCEWKDIGEHEGIKTSTSKEHGGITCIIL